MRLISGDAYSFGEGNFAWSGLLDPKLYQRYTWLLTIPIFSPVIIGINKVTSFSVSSSIESHTRGVSVGNVKVGVRV